MKQRSAEQHAYLNLLATTRQTLLALGPKLDGIERENTYRLAGLIQRLMKARAGR